MAELWGFQAGEQQAQQYTQNQALFNLQMQEGGLKLEEEAVQTQTAKLALQQQQKMLELLSQRGAAQMTRQASADGKQPLPGTGTPIDETADATEQAGLDLLAVGDVEHGSQTLERASTMRRNAAQIEKDSNDQRARDLTVASNLFANSKPKLDAIDAQEASGAIDAQTADAARNRIWQDGNMQYMSITGKPSPVAAQPYSRQLFDAVENANMTQLQKAQQAAAAARQKLADAQVQAQPLKNAEIAARTKAANARADAVEKAGGEAKPPAGFEWKLDKDGKPVLDEDGQRILKPITGGPGVTRGGGFGSAYVLQQANRVVASGNQALQEAQNIMELPVTTNTGYLQGPLEPGLTGITKNILTRKVSSQDVQAYSTMSSGIQRFAAQIETMGTAQGLQHFSEQIGPQLILQPGDTVYTKLLKMAELRQNVTAALEVLQTEPQLSKDQKQKIQDIRDGFEKSVPFTVHDVNALWMGDSKSLLKASKEAGLGKGGGKPSSGWGQATIVTP
jgi:hypothetical protein